MIKPDSKVTFHLFKTSSATNKKGEVNLVRWDTDKTIRVEAKVVPIVYLLSWGKTVRQVADQVGVEIESVINLLNFLQKQGLIKFIDDLEIKDESDKIHPWFIGLPRSYFSWVLSYGFIAFSLAFIICGVVISLIIPGLSISYKNYFWHPNLFIVFISIYLIDYVVTMLHEVAHFIATKAVGGEAKISVGYRYIYLVFQTESYHLGVVPKYRRFIVYLAGIYSDLLILAGCFWFLYFKDILNLPLGVGESLIYAIVVIVLWKVLWQLNVALETDVFNVITDDLEMENLRADAKKMLALKIKSLGLGKHLFKWFHDADVRENADNFSDLASTQKKQVRYYLVLMFIGLIWASVRYLFFIFPRDLTFLSLSLFQIIQSLANFDLAGLSENSLILIVLGTHYLLLGFFILKDKLSGRSRLSISTEYWEP